MAKTIDFQESYIVLENNPTAITNNYSPGKTAGHQNNDTWYRWNGIALKGESQLKARTFDLSTTIIGDYSYMVNEEKYFNYSIWFDLQYWNGTEYETDGWIYAFIGNDSYEPLGHEDPDRIHKDYADCYAGRFFTNYDESYTFSDPDTTMMADGLSYRQAYEESPYPYWHINFHVENNRYVVSINGHAMPSLVVFDPDYIEHGVPYANQDIEIHRVQLNLVNYGNPDGSPAPSYSGTFTKPRIIEG